MVGRGGAWLVVAVVVVVVVVVVAGVVIVVVVVVALVAVAVSVVVVVVVVVAVGVGARTLKKQWSLGYLEAAQTMSVAVNSDVSITARGATGVHRPLPVTFGCSHSETPL